MSHCYRAGLLLAFGLLSAIPARAQQIAFERITEADGLPGGVVTAIAQDQQGFLWVGTWAGLARYDGYTFTHFHHDPADSTTRRKGAVESLYADSKGYVWVGYYGSDGGLDRFDPATEAFAHFRHDPDDPGSISEGQVITVYEDSEGFIWVSIQRFGVDRYDPEADTFAHYPHDADDPASLSNISVRVIYEDSHGVLWFGAGEPGSRPESGGGLNRYDRERDAFTRYLHDPQDPTSLNDNRVQVIYEDSRGTLWIGTWGDGLHTYDRERDAFTRFTYGPDDPSRPSLPRVRRSGVVNDPMGYGVTVVHEDRDGMLWIGGYLRGLDRFDTATGTRAHYEYDPNDPYSLGDNRIWQMCESHDGTLWIATWGGLFKVDPAAGRFRNYVHDANDPSTVGAYYVTALHVDRSGDLWVGTSRGGLQALDRARGTFTNFPADHARLQPTDYRVTRIFEDRYGTLWVGSRGLRYLDRRAGRVVEADVAISSEILEIHEDEEGVLWIGTSEGLYRYDRGAGTLMHYRHEQQSSLRPFDVIYAIGEAQDDALWLGTAGGLSRFDRATHTLTTVLEDTAVTALLERRPGELWLATQGRGLFRYDAETGGRTSYTTPDGLANDVVGSILQDDQGFLWLGTNRGLSKFDAARRRFRNYDVAAGLSTNILGTDGETRAAAKARGGALYFGGMGGFVRVSPALAADNPVPPRLVLTGMEYTDRDRRAGAHPEVALPLALAGNMQLAHTQNDLTFAYVGLHFANPAGNAYAYMLEGYEDAWRYVGTQRTATYTNLSPGSYTFRVKAANADGVWSDAAASIDFVILPPWWRTGWAYAFYVVIIAAGVFAVDRIQRRRLIRRERAKAVVREAELRAEAAQERTATLQQLDALKSRFFANISHEFRTPLTLLLGPLDDALRDAKPDLHFSQRQVTAMRHNTRRLLRLVNQLLDLSRLEAGSMVLKARRADLVAFLHRITLAFASRAEREHITLSFHTEEKELPLRFDRDKMEKVFYNLLSNAFKFTTSGGKIRLSISRIAPNGDPWVAVRVKDTGQGISVSEVPHVFDRFYQVDSSSTRAHEGTGIGLALVKELVELHNGAVEVESEVGFGTTFIVRLPVIPESNLEESSDLAERVPETHEMWFLEEKEYQAAASFEAEDALPGRPSILVVEDNADVRAYLRDRLGGHYRILEARDGLEGLELARAEPPDLVLADVMMPRMDGHALCRALKQDEALSSIPVVLLTAKADEASKLEGLEQGADDYLTKPFNTEELLLRVENLIEIRRRLRRRFSGEVVVTPGKVVVSSEEAAFLERVREAAELHMAESSFGVEALAGQVGLSRRQLQRRLQTLTELSPSGYLRMVRLERAAQLLEQQAGQVQEVARQVGFGSVEHFSRLFHQVFGVPPSQYPAETDSDMSTRR